MTNNVGWSGFFEIKTLNGIDVVKNRIMDVALDELLKVLQGQTTNLEIKYLAVGRDGTPVTNNQVLLGNEVFRTPFLSRNKSGIGELRHVTVIRDNEAVGSIREIGVFGGSSATDQANSGILISRILWSRDKTSLEEIQITRIDRIVRG